MKIIRTWVKPYRKKYLCLKKILCLIKNIENLTWYRAHHKPWFILLFIAAITSIAWYFGKS